jgi:hypothetical protein
MNKFTAFALGLFMAFFASLAPTSAHASFAATPDPSVCTVAPCYGWQTYANNGAALQYFDNYAAACAFMVARYQASGGASCVLAPNGLTFNIVTGTSGTYTGAGTRVGQVPPSPPAYTCPSNSTLGGTSCTCNAGFDQSGSSCVPHVNVCTAKTGKPWITNFTVGYTRTDGLGSNSDDYSCVGTCNQVPVSKQICDNGCTVDLGQANAAWRSTTPTANGLYRLSIDFISVPTGAECTQGAGDAPANPATPEPACPGFVGEINGKKGCYGTASSPITTTAADRTAQGAAPGNPAAGSKPSAGQGSGSTGSGRTPSTGTGGPSGGPASAAAGPNGVIPKPAEGEEQAECGAPGQPKCAIDETGTPAPVGTGENNGPFGTAEGILGAAKTGVQNAINEQKQLQAPPWTWTFSLPSGCTPFVMEAFNMSLNICQYQPLVHDLMSIIWIIVGIFAAVGMTQRTLRGS